MQYRLDMKEKIAIASPALEYLRASLVKRYDSKGRTPEYSIELSLDPTLPENGFLIKREKEKVFLSAKDLASLFCGSGTLLHGDERADGFHAMKKPFRGIYFATHFDNYYCRASETELEEYIADLALWGFNVLVFWHDMHHFESWEAPSAKAHRERLFFLAECAGKCGMKVVSLHLANEGPMDVKTSLRARKLPGIYSRGGWYDSQICPSLPEGRKELEAHFQKVIRDFLLPLKPDHVILWPYDQGGCQCENCSPWGGNGFIKASSCFAELLKKQLPGCGIIFSTWFMDAGETALLAEAIRKGVLPCSYLTIEQEHRALNTLLPEPEDISIIGFPDISMRMNPWGGWGMDPQPTALQKEWDECKTCRQGGYLYSEGIFDDINKIIFSQFYCWDRDAGETVRLYGSYMCGEKYADAFTEMIYAMEENAYAVRIDPREKMLAVQKELFRESPEPSFDQLIHTLEKNGLSGCWQYVMKKKGNDFLFHRAETAKRNCECIEYFLPANVKNSPFWRIIRARVTIDAAVAEYKGQLPRRAFPWLAEIEKCYGATENTVPELRPVKYPKQTKLHTKASLTEDLEKMGLPHNTALLVHSSFKSIGKVEGGPETVLEALIEYLIPHGGLLLFPTFTYLLARDEVYSVKETPCLTGILPELFRKRPGVIRSLDPTHSIAALGNGAEELLAGCENSKTSFDAFSIWPKLMERDGKVLFLGTGLACNTFLHYTDEQNAPFDMIYKRELEKRAVIDGEGKKFIVERHPMYAPRSDSFTKMREIFRKENLIHSGLFGEAEAELISCRQMTEKAAPLIRKYPEIFQDEDTPLPR